MTRYIEHLVSELLRYGHQVTVVCGERNSSSYIKKENHIPAVKTIELDIVEELKYDHSKWPIFSQKMKFILKTEQPHCIVLQHPYHARGVILANKISGCPVIYICHTLAAVDVQLRGCNNFINNKDDNIKREQYVLKNADVIICVSKAVKKSIKHYYNIPIQKLHHVPTGVSPFPNSGNSPLFSKFNRIKSRGMRVVLYAGRESWEKGTDLLPDIIENVTQQYKSVYFVLIGINRVNWARYLLLPRTMVLPWLTDSELAYIYKQCDILLLPSRRDSMPYVLLEAMLHGLAPVVTDVDGPGEIIRENINGKKIKPDFINGKIYIQAEKFSSSIISILINETQLNRIQKHNSELIKNKFTLANQSRKFFSVIKKFT